MSSSIYHEPGRLGVEYQVLEAPSSARAELPLLLRVQVRNTGAAPWANRGANPINMSYHWLDERGQAVDFEGVRTILPGPLRSGESVELTLTVEPPPHGGDYLLALDMVEEGIDWFSVRGIAPLTLPISVAPAPPGIRRVCIVNGNCVLNDAVGNHVLNQLRFFHERGYQALVLLDHLDLRHPPELRQHMARVTLDELRAGPDNPQTRRAVAHFQRADLYVFNYSTYYPLVEAIRLAHQGMLVFDYHGVTPPQLWDGHGAETLEEGQRRLDLVRYADYAIAHSSFTRDELLRTGAIAPERVYQMAYVVPLDRFHPGPRPAELVERYRLDADQPVLLYVGRMAANKQISDLVRALPLVCERFPRAVLMLVGDDRSAAYAQVASQARSLARDLGVAERVIFTGQVPDGELTIHYLLADLFVTASLHEGFCIPAIEAQACGRPVVGAHATALPETIGPGGLTFRPRDHADLARKVLELLENRCNTKQANPVD
ncbi:MAG TPA: glycosyltransferase [Roseiflexaceae bacterium]|nr:glycosyltransferase [Roseiflexaceae bacterium]